MIFNYLNLNKNDKYYLILVFLFSFFLIYKLIEFYMSCGIFDPDKSIYLIVALKFAGLDYNNICVSGDIFYTPVICFLTSLLFRLGLVDKLAIFIVTGVFGIICELGIYILFRQRFNSLLSFTGVIIFGSLSVVLWHIGSGGIDIPSIAISVWVIIFTLIAVEKNPKFFILVFPLLVLGFFTRYTVGFILPVLFVYYAINKDVYSLFKCFISDRTKFKHKVINYLKSDEFKYIFISLILGLILIIIICLFILNNGGSLTFIEQSSNTFNNVKHNAKAVDYNPSLWYYLKNLPSILFEDNRFLDSTLSFSILGILIFGCLLKIYDNYKNFEINNDLFLKLIYLLTGIGVVISFIFIQNHMICNICLVINLICLFYLLNNDEVNFKFVLLNLSWLGISFIFASIYQIKVPRYSLPFIIPLIYFVVLGLEEILSKLGKILNSSKVNLLPILLICLLVMSGVIFVSNTIYEIGSDAGVGLIDASNYIKNNDPGYMDKDITVSERFYPVIKLYLMKNATNLRDYEIDLADSMNSTYVIHNQEIDFKNYHKIYYSKGTYLYMHN